MSTAAQPRLVTDRLDEVLEDYFAAYQLKPRTMESKRILVRKFQKFLRTRYDGPATDTDVDRVIAWSKHLGRTHGRRYVTQQKSAVISLLRFALPEGVALPRTRLRMPLRSDNLRAILRDYLNARQLCKKERDRMETHVVIFNRWLRDRGNAYEEETESTRVSAFIAELAERKIGPDKTFEPETVNNYRQTLMRLLRFATPDGEPLPRADRIRRQREPEKYRPAFTRDELRLLIAAAPYYRPTSNLVRGRGTVRAVVPRPRQDGVAWSVWWEAFVRVAYESGQYLSDLRVLRWDQIAADGSISFVRHKTGRTVQFRLSPIAIEAARAIGHPTLILPWDYDMAAYFGRQWKRFLSTVEGVRPLGAKSIRRASITYTYIEQGEEAAKTLAGHANFATTSRHYIDWSIAKKQIISPPSL